MTQRTPTFFETQILTIRPPTFGQRLSAAIRGAQRLRWSRSEARG
jgi:hypothetical protein